MTRKIYLLSIVLLSIILQTSCHILKQRNNPIQNKIYENAKANIGDESWALLVDRQAKRKATVHFNSGEYKCNLFVYEVILASGFDIGTPNHLNGITHPILAVEGKLDRPPCTSDWYYNYDTKVRGAKFVGEGNEGLKNAIPGDIITDGKHMGIIAGNSKTISANTYKIVNNDWGFRGTEARPVRIFRIDSSIQLSNNYNTFNISSNVNNVNNQNDECDTCYCNIDMDSYYTQENNQFYNENDKDNSENKKSPWLWIGIGIGILVLIIIIITCICCCKQ